MHDTEIAKEFTFHAAHQLPNHDGQCRRRHGHSYRVRIALRGQAKPANGDPDEGMVLDFGVVKDLWKSQCEPHLEHQDLNETIGNDGRLPTTAENIARWIYVQLRAYSALMVTHLYDVTVWETPTSSARFPVY